MNELASKRDRRLRRRMLSSLYHSRGQARGGLSGRTLVDLVNGLMPFDQRFEDEAHAISLLRDLEGKSLVTWLDERRHPKREAFGLDRIFAAITAKGVSLMQETIEPDADVEDERDVE